MRGFQSALGHLTIVFSGVFLTLTIINVFNPAMQFLSGTVTKVFLVLFCLIALSLAVVTILENRRINDLLRERAEQLAARRHFGNRP